jgi:hypothetical protein
MLEKAGDGDLSVYHLTTGATTAVEIALENAVHRHQASMAALQRAVEACVTEMRGKGLPPEAMIITMKAFIRHTATVHPPPGNLASSWAADAYLEQIIKWSITQYYRPTS